MTRFRLRTAFECPAAWAGRGTFNAPSRQERCGELTSRWRASCYTLRRSITTFDKREEGFEQKFAHEEAMRFKATARRNKPLGLRRGTGVARALGSVEVAEQIMRVLRPDHDRARNTQARWCREQTNL
jgi:hypothetical protein